MGRVWSSQAVEETPNRNPETCERQWTDSLLKKLGEMCKLPAFS